MSGNLFGNVLKAKQQFAKDILLDKDYIEYRETSTEFKTLNVAQRYYYLYNNLSSVDFIKEYIKKYNIKI